MEGYGPGTYGRSFADVYDDWYGNVSDVAATIRMVTALAGGGPVVEMGVGTGRLAKPLAAAGLSVHGLDTSPEMLARLSTSAGADRPTAVLADMTAPPYRAGTARVVLFAYNTLLNLLDLADQRRALAAAAELLGPDGVVVVEAFLPADPGDAPSGDLSVRSVTVDRVELHVTRTDPTTRTVAGQIVEITEAGGVRLRPWALRATTPAELDRIAGETGLTLVSRHGGWDDELLDDDATRHVSAYRRA
ncbi:MAG: methyltransferase domain-containing protein [Acidimicrobiales bacterium]